MTLTKEIIEREMRIWKRNGYIEGTVWARHYIDLCRLALLGLERDTRAERIGRAVIESGFNVSDAEAVRTIYSWAGNGASRIVDCMRAIADAMEDEA